jgi:hypothetical protein
MVLLYFCSRHIIFAEVVHSPREMLRYLSFLSVAVNSPSDT